MPGRRDILLMLDVASNVFGVSCLTANRRRRISCYLLAFLLLALHVLVQYNLLLPYAVTSNTQRNIRLPVSAVVLSSDPMHQGEQNDVNEAMNFEQPTERSGKKMSALRPARIVGARQRQNLRRRSIVGESSHSHQFNATNLEMATAAEICCKRREDVVSNVAEDDTIHTQRNDGVAFNCANIGLVTLKRKLGHGVSKQVYLGLYNKDRDGMSPRRVAVKMVTRRVIDVTSCLQEKMAAATASSMATGTKPGTSKLTYAERQRCNVLPNMKLMKEILLLQQLKHTSLVQLLGYCVRSEETESTSLADHGVVAVYEYGQRFYSSSLSAWTVRRRLEAALGLADLLCYFEHSPLGSLRIADFKEAHFLLTSSGGSSDHRIKLTDLDDVHNMEPSCSVETRAGVQQNIARHTVNNDSNNNTQGAEKLTMSAIFPDPLSPAADSTVGGEKGRVSTPPPLPMNGAREEDAITGSSRDNYNDDPKRRLGSVVVHQCEYNLDCVGGLCVGYNAKYNMDRMNRLFFQSLLVSDNEKDVDEQKEEKAVIADSAGGETIIGDYASQSLAWTKPMAPSRDVPEGGHNIGGRSAVEGERSTGGDNSPPAVTAANDNEVSRKIPSSWTRTTATWRSVDSLRSRSSLTVEQIIDSEAPLLLSTKGLHVLRTQLNRVSLSAAQLKELISGLLKLLPPSNVKHGP